MAEEESCWKECCKWLTRVGLLPPDHRANWSSATIKDFAYCLRDGVQLCRLLNLLSEDAIDMKEISQKPQMAQFLCLRNIRTFLQACKTNFGLKDSDLFQPPMLFDLSDFNKVLYTLSRLSQCKSAQDKQIEGFCATSQSTLDDELCETFEDFNSEPTAPLVILPQKANQSDESVYEELCYIHFRVEPPKALVTVRERRDYVKGELLETERNYNDALSMIKKKFMKPLSTILKEDRKIIFFGIKELSEFHSGFLGDLTRVLTSNGSSQSNSLAYCGTPTKSLGDVFSHWKPKFVIYGDYCANLTKAQNLIEELCAKSEVINDEVMKCEKEANEGKFRLRDLLSVPMQRVLKYHLLLENLLQDTTVEQHGIEEYKSVERAKDAMFDIAEYTNEVKRDSETFSIIRQIENSIYDLKMPDGMELKDYGRLQRDGELKVKDHSESSKLKTRYVFIFDKVMLMCKSTKGDQYGYKHSLCLQEYRVEDAPPATIKKGVIRDIRWSHCWNLVHIEQKNVYTMFAQTIDKKKEWIKAIEDALNNIQPEDARRSDHLFTMNTFEKGGNCYQCDKFMKGLFFQGYRCVRCGLGVHKECISQVHSCGTFQPPQLPPRPPLLPIPCLSHSESALSLASPTLSVTDGGTISSFYELSPRSPSTPNNINAGSTSVQNVFSQDANPSSVSPHYVNLIQLDSYAWYAGEMDRDAAGHLLQDESDGSFLVRIRPAATVPIYASDATYALSLKWKGIVKHMKILFDIDRGRYCLSESRYFKSVVELVHWYQHHSLSESFSGLDTCLGQPVGKTIRGNVQRSPSRYTYDFHDNRHQSMLFSQIQETRS